MNQENQEKIKLFLQLCLGGRCERLYTWEGGKAKRS